MESNGAWIDFTITRGPIRGKERNKIGLIIRLQTRPDVEEFISGLVNGRRYQVDAVGEGWTNCNPEAAPLEVYEFENGSVEQRNYTLENVTGPLLIPQNDGRLRIGGTPPELVNLSFLRVVGVSNPSGVVIGLPGAYSSEYVKRVRNTFPSAVKQFLQDYLVPITINLQVLSRS
jgi:hypothetical protein